MQDVSVVVDLFHQAIGCGLARVWRHGYFDFSVFFNRGYPGVGHDAHEGFRGVCVQDQLCFQRRTRRVVTSGGGYLHRELVVPDFLFLEDAKALRTDPPTVFERFPLGRFLCQNIRVVEKQVALQVVELVVGFARDVVLVLTVRDGHVVGDQSARGLPTVGGKPLGPRRLLDVFLFQAGIQLGLPDRRQLVVRRGDRQAVLLFEGSLEPRFRDTGGGRGSAQEDQAGG
mmetsp:Transcript_7141/g.14581  ORF Transcript_7141/g.14581 Transcript_7141/m.14581 type:complete len:228 (+) Transcript_7141:516-1199(+)